MYHWLTSKNVKVHQRRMNKRIRDFNNNIKNDSLWRGRFYVHQVGRQRLTYEDGSGMELWVILELVDRKTGRTKRISGTVNHLTFTGDLWMAMNSFIVDTISVWSEDPRPGTKEWFENIDWEE